MVLVLKKVEQDEDEDCIDIEPTFDNSSEMIKVQASCGLHNFSGNESSVGLYSGIDYIE